MRFGVRGFILNEVMLDARLFGLCEDRGPVHLTRAQSDVILDIRAAREGTGFKTLLHILHVHQLPTAAVFLKQCDGIFARKHHPEHIHLVGDPFGFSFADEQIKQVAIAEFNKLITVNVIEKFDALLGQRFTRVVEHFDGIAAFRFIETILVGNPSHAGEFQTKRLGVLGHALGIVAITIIRKMPADSLQIALLEHAQKYFGRKIVSPCQLNFSDACGLNFIKSGRNVFDKICSERVQLKPDRPFETGTSAGCGSVGTMKEQGGDHKSRRPCNTAEHGVHGCHYPQKQQERKIDSEPRRDRKSRTEHGVFHTERISGTAHMLSVEQTLEQILRRVNPLEAADIPIMEASGRIAAESVLARCDLPPFDNSAMDGYAVHSTDVRNASATQPVLLRIAGRTAAGQVAGATLKPGECLRIFTGAPMPQGADAVVMQEDTETDGDWVRVLDGVRPWENIRFRGEDLKIGAEVARAGQRLTPQQLGLMAAAGVETVSVRRKPRLALLSTGNELVHAGQHLGPGQIYESNRVALAALLQGAGAETTLLPMVRDRLEDLTALFAEILPQFDGLVSTGGVSVGELDFVKEAFQSAGGQLESWRVAMKPGKPFAFGHAGRTLFFGLPGNPVSAFVTASLLVLPSVQRWQGATHLGLRRVSAQLKERIVNKGDRRHYVRVALGADGQVRPTGPQASHLLVTLAQADGLLDVPPHGTFEAGAWTEVLLLP